MIELGWFLHYRHGGKQVQNKVSGDSEGNRVAFCNERSSRNMFGANPEPIAWRYRRYADMRTVVCGFCRRPSSMADRLRR